ncbi:hypothetical protein U879_16355 [Defluviimonas sp. 20V17]|uniref:Lipoprotein n=1 Tax=Allgaiera indica TaxID=765699 RepID=A0AAN4URA7_9RHOB|nr:hypothetical protein [Allgaiera indica]KDB02596.1 hypothetical protein U879_16355 [Defluviimonas sp. 20V17]GHE01692.1 hypothetical protein GCM10008024_18190 [Allgaiera indica]SDW95794.1 hypothetical protein SAMN05444006_108130 [Allgaiera indica]
MGRTGLVLMPLGGVLALASCAQQGDLAQQCLRQLKPYGDYHYRQGAAVPEVRPGLNGTWPEANALNACIQQKAARRAKAAPAAPAPRAAAGKLPLPTAYPLMPGDAALWPTLTLAQQRRALVFLRDGSTIRSSLEGQ